jgi:hypothetical protein
MNLSATAKKTSPTRAAEITVVLRSSARSLTNKGVGSESPEAMTNSSYDVAPFSASSAP